MRFPSSYCRICTTTGHQAKVCTRSGSIFTVVTFKCGRDAVYVIFVLCFYRHSPTLLYTLLMFLIAAFKTYPSVADAIVPLSLLPLWASLLSCMSLKCVCACVHIYSSQSCLTLSLCQLSIRYAVSICGNRRVRCVYDITTHHVALVDLCGFG